MITAAGLPLPWIEARVIAVLARGKISTRCKPSTADKLSTAETRFVSTRCLPSMTLAALRLQQDLLMRATRP